MTLSLWWWILIGNSLCGWQEATKMLEVSLDSKRPQVSLLERKETYSMTSDASWQTTRQTGSQCAILWLQDISTLAKVGQSTFAFQFLFTFKCIRSVLLFVACLFHFLAVIIHHLVSCFVFTFIHSAWSFQICFSFCSVRSLSSDYSLFNYLVLFSVLILDMYSSYFLIPKQHPSSKTINIRPQDCAIFCLSIGSESLLQS
jgi:hypothetical protein